MNLRAPGFDLATLIRILEESDMRFQDPKLEKHGKGIVVWRIRPYVSVVTPEGNIQRVRKPITLGRVSEMTKQQALAEKQKAMATVNAGKITVQAQLPFSALLDKYVAGKLPLLNASTQAKYSNHIDNHIRPAFAEMKLCEIDKPTVQIWMNSKREKLSWATCADLRSILGSIFTQAAEWRMWQGENPAHKVKLGKQTDKREKKILDEARFAKFLACIPETCIMPAAKVKLMVMVAVIGGLRVSEVLGLKPCDIDIERGTAMIQRRWHRGDVSEPKTDESKAEVEITRELAAQIVGLGDNWLFARQDTTEPPDDRDLQQHVFRPAAELAGCYFPGFGMHTFRRMKVTWSQQAGASALEAMLLARHRDLKTTLRYTIVEDKRRSELTHAVARKAVQ